MGQPLRVLLVEDSEDDALLVIREIKKGGYDPEYVRVETAEALAEELRNESWDIILCDYQMPRFDGPRAIEEVKNSGIDIPLLIVSGAIGEELAVEAMRKGANDYIMKDHLARLVPAIERELAEADSRQKRREAEEEIARQHRELEQVINAMVAQVWYLDREGRVVNCNRCAEISAGVSSHLAVGKTIRELASGWDDPERRHEETLRVVRTGQPLLGSIEWYRGRDGLQRWVSVDKIPWYDVNGEIIGVLLFIYDITERHMVEQELRESKSLLESAGRMARFGGWSAYPADKRVRWSDQVAAIHEMPVGTTLTLEEWIDFVVPGWRNHVTEAFEKCALSGIPFDEEVEINTAQGRTVWVRITAEAVRGESGAVTQLRGALQDITERKNSIEKLRKALESTVQAMALMVETRDPYTAGHQRRVADLSRAIAGELGLSADRVEGTYMAATIHDIGKISVPAEILSKPTTLTETEFSLIKEHPRAGYDILKDIEFPWPIARIVLEHHERQNESGYPRGLKGEDMLQESRILAVADVVESMASHRPYRPSMGLEAALREITTNSGVLYDPEVVTVCVRLFRRGIMEKILG